MNTIKLQGKLYKYESFWRKSKDDNTLDYNKIIFPYPKPNNIWNMRQIFIQKFIQTQKEINKYIKYKPNKYTHCLICGKKEINKGLYELNRIRWEDGLIHYLVVHNIKPSDDFIDIIFRFQVDPKIISKKRLPNIKGIVMKKSNKVYLKIDRNQLLIMDALMEHGSKKTYVDNKNRKVYRYSEHAGLLDFDKYGLERIIISGKTNRVDENDNEIFLPKNMIDTYDYEYIFHTHPPTPKIGGRVIYGVLYEFPSISDLFHFMDHYNEGSVQGSIIIAPEGLYVIRKKIHDNKKIDINENKFYKEAQENYSKIQNTAINKFGENFTNKTFYSKIAQDKTFINGLNKIINKFQIHIDYYPRIINNKSQWILDTIYLPVFVVEPSKEINL